MSKLPPALLYLTIYNPTLLPTGPVDKDDEDAEEQAHILFYTARERAVSRDKMLRQVGLAKALVNFSSMFAQEEACENVHSQSRRMIMLCPEPNFWIHACFELAKTQKPVAASSGAKTSKGKSSSATKDGGKGKSAGKEKDKDKGKSGASAGSEGVQWDWYDGSVHDEVLRRQLMKGYEQFKLIHGSFTTILRDQGPEVLEVQLERFFTVWAWRWDIDHDSELGEHLGIPLHPLYPSILPVLDEFTMNLQTEDAESDSPTPFLLIPPHVIPSSTYSSSHPSHALPLYLRSRFPPPRPPSLNDPSSSSKGGDSRVNSPGDKDEGVGGAGTAAVANAFVAIGQSMDVRRWNWGALTFGKGGTSSGSGWNIRGMTGASGSEPGVTGKEESKEAEGQDTAEDGDGKSKDVERPSIGQNEEGIKVDTESLHDAISSYSVPPPDPPLQSQFAPPPPPDIVNEDQPLERSIAPSSSPKSRDFAIASFPEPSSFSPPAPTATNISSSSPVPLVNSLPSASSSPSSSPVPSSQSLPDEHSTSTHSSPPSIPPPPLPIFLPLSVHLSPRDDPNATSRRRVLYTIRNQIALAFIARSTSEYTDDDMIQIQQAALALLDKVQGLLQDEAYDGNPDTPTLPSATKILQPKDKYILDIGRGTTLSSPQFTSTSEHLFLAEEFFQTPNVLEVFSRTQGAQHWQIAKRESNISLVTEASVNPAMDGSSGGDAVMYMEISRKETSLADVENELAEVVRKVSDGRWMRRE
ncbi:uncharacterized protein STEHIDRAFT_168790 [Stereum hirsutum FP-91666 SS1]|uniref:uncharacterized protein n=1 Tax=Stereum hirsutum (strain FP-91666) TaxID=721885 RepID=UPI000444968A|nr:uncharacterized protein STEHIDRAFT_168790 [Stereum hirsutum FP-91666 SS1]EIM86915.1 hypothetical protein STEHIDRAFT_168790 [Stereum hirsutum FP-91666 SS1]